MSKKVDLSRFNNDWYSPGSFFKRASWFVINIIFFKSSLPYPNVLKVFLLRLFGIRAGNGIVIKTNVNIKYPWFLELGNNVWMGENCWLDNLGSVKIGSNVCISQGAFIFSGNHNYKKETFDLLVRDIVIEDGVWVGAKSIICPGVTLKTHSVISVGSIITADTEPYSIYKSFTTKKIKARAID